MTVKAGQIRLARGVSLLGHPSALLPAAIMVRLFMLEAGGQRASFMLVCVLAIAGSVLLYSLWQVRQGRWEHVDASVKAERGGLNLVLVGLLWGAGGVSFMLGQARIFTLGLCLVGGIVAFGWALSRWVKLSLHTSFAVFAAFLFWPQGFYVLTGIGLALLIGWSRLVLERHSVGDIVAGIAAGLGAGLAQVAGGFVFGG